MSGKHIWKLAITGILVAFCLSYLIPLNDEDFATHIRERTDSSEFHALLDRAIEASESSERPTSVYMALKGIANEERIDLSQYFPDKRLEASLTNVEKRNNILLPVLLEESKANLKKGLDIQGGVSVTFQVDPAALAEVPADQRDAKLADAINIIERRVNSYGVAEPIVRPVGDSRIELQLAGVNTKDNPDLLDIIQAPARLDFREVHPTADPRFDSNAPPGYEVMTMIQEFDGTENELQLYVKRIPALSGKHVAEAFPSQTQMGGIEVILNLTDEGAELFADVTRRLAAQGGNGNAPGRLAIVLDGELQSAPTVREEIRGGRASISGRYTQREAIDLANTLNNPLELPLSVVEMYEVGPSMAADSIASGVLASKVGVISVAIFMIIYYMVGGLVALIGVVLNVVIVLGVLASFNATLTLPGIAGIILTVGMAVDANILIFERIREELKAGKSLKSSIAGGFDKAFSTIFDANLTTLLVSFVMLGLGTGPVKGFGLTLAVGVMTTMFCALIVTRVMLELLFETGALKKFRMLSLVKNPTFEFLKYGKPAFLVSWTIVVLGVIGMFVRSDSIFGIDFTGGDEVVLSFEERIGSSDIRDALQAADVGEVTPIYQTQLGGQEEDLRVQAPFGTGDEVVSILQEKFPEANFEVVGMNEIGPTVGKEIQLNAALALAVSLGLILLYVAFRFEIGYGVGAVVSSIHDILLTVGIFAIAPGYQFSAAMVAAILLVVGYSINDTIVVFDRIREELQLKPTAKLREVINFAINAVLSRTLLTSITTLLASLSLLIFGTGIINDIAFTFTIGIITGTFSSVFIATPVFYWWHKGDRRSVESSHDIAPEYDWQASSKVSSTKSASE